MRDKFELYMNVAEAVAKFGTCPRAQVGAIIVKDDKIIGTGYNGSAVGEAHCTDPIENGGGCILEERRGRQHCIRTMHAEVNAIINSRADARGGTMYCTHQPCYDCSRAIVNAGIAFVYYKKEYPGDTQRDNFVIQARKTKFYKLKVQS
jgi:dCMP deaminase